MDSIYDPTLWDLKTSAENRWQTTNYPNLFKSRYPSLRGKDWIKTISPEDRAVFVDIGNQANDHGKKGGQAMIAKRGKGHMSNIGRIGAIVSNVKRQWIKAVREETERELGIVLDY